MDIGNLLGAFAFCMAGMFFIWASLKLLRSHVWIETTADITDADVSGGNSTRLSICVAYQVVENASGIPDGIAPSEQYEKWFPQDESMFDKFASKQDRIDSAMANRTITLWYSQQDPELCHIEQPSNTGRFVRGMAGIGMGVAMMLFALGIAKYGPDGFWVLVHWVVTLFSRG